jgi:hypothetical protein
MCRPADGSESAGHATVTEASGNAAGPACRRARRERYHRRMSETSPTEPTSAADTTESSAEPSPESDTAEPAAESEPVSHANDSSSAPRASKLSRWATVAALVLAVIATSVAVVGWFYPHKSASSAPTYTDQQTKDAEKQICKTFLKVDRAVVRNARIKPPPEWGPVGGFSVATAARQAFLGGAAYLRDQVSQTPATPPDLAKSVNDMSSNLADLAIGYLAGETGFTQDELRQSLDDKIKSTIEIMVKEGVADRNGDRATCKS